MATRNCTNFSCGLDVDPMGSRSSRPSSDSHSETCPLQSLLPCLHKSELSTARRAQNYNALKAEDWSSYQSPPITRLSTWELSKKLQEEIPCSRAGCTRRAEKFSTPPLPFFVVNRLQDEMVDFFHTPELKNEDLANGRDWNWNSDRTYAFGGCWFGIQRGGIHAGLKNIDLADINIGMEQSGFG